MSDDKTRILTAAEAERWPVVADQADDKTRVLTGDEAARIMAGQKPPAKAATPAKKPAGEPLPAPQFIDDKIVFYCSAGHKITLKRSLAGRPGKCQGIAKQGCGVAFVVPVPPDVESEAPPAAEADMRPPEPLAIETAEGAAPPDATTTAPEPEEPAGDAPAWDFTAAGAPATAEVAAVDAGVESAPGWTFDLDQLDNPTARLVARLWLERAHGGVVEVHLSGGSVIMPEWYDPQWSSGTHAVFAALAADGTLTLTAVAWEQVQKVVVRQVQGTPDGMFEG